MSRKTTNQKAGQAWERAREAAAQAGSGARSAGAAARRGVHRMRTWAAPRVERTGRVLQDSVAPRISAWLSAAARRIEPPKERSPRWLTRTRT